jgi:hypothetical protein
MCPLEEVYRWSSATGDWAEIPTSVFDSKVKAVGVLSREVPQLFPLFSIRQAGPFTQYVEDLFGYHTI